MRPAEVCSRFGWLAAVSEGEEAESVQAHDVDLVQSASIQPTVEAQGGIVGTEHPPPKSAAAATDGGAGR